MWRGLSLFGCLAALSCLTGLGCAPAPAAPAAPRRVAAAEPRVSAAPEQPEPTLVTLYEDRWPGLDAVLLGVDPAHHRAYLKLRLRGKGQRYVIDTIDYAAGERVERWEAEPERAKQLVAFDSHFAPLSRDRSADFDKLSGMMSRWPTRYRRAGSHWPIDDVSPSGALIYSARPSNGRDGDWLYLRRPDRKPVRIDRGLVASYDAKFSPDGEHIAWQGCRGRKPCRYQLYVSRTRDAVRGRRPRRIDELPHPSGPVWAPDGRSLFVISQPKDADACVVRVPLTGKRPKPIACSAQLRTFTLDARASKLVHSARTADRRSLITLLSVDQPRDAVRFRVRGSGEVSVSPGGLLLSDHVDGVMAIDSASGRRRLLSSNVGFIYVPTTHWLDGGRALMLRKSFDEAAVALVLLDVARFVESG